MDSRLEKALEFTNYRKTIADQKENLKLKVEKLLIYSHNGGLFKITPELISFVKYLSEKSESGILLDNNMIPIEIKNLSIFLDEIFSRYSQVMNEYLREYSLLKKARSIKSLVKLNDEETN